MRRATSLFLLLSVVLIASPSAQGRHAAGPTQMIAPVLAVIAVFALITQPAPTASNATAVVAGTTASVYVAINNPTMYDIYVMSATSEVAGKVELYSADQPVDNMTVAAYGSLTLKAGGMFLRLSDIKRELKAGESIAVTMMTDGGVAIAATAVVTP